MMSANFSTPDEDVIKRQVKVSKQVPKYAGSLEKVYEIPECIDWIQRNNFNRIGLQMPDELMKDAVSIADKIQANVEGKVFILGDTSYGSCCVDEVTAEHYNADCIIHYGHSCLSLTCRLPVKFVFGQSPIDIKDLGSKLQDSFPDKTQLIVLLYDTDYYYIVDKISEEITQSFNNFFVSKLDIPLKDSCESSSFCKCNRIIDLPSNLCLDDAIMLYLGQESLTLTNLMISFKQNNFYTYNSLTLELRKETSNVNRMLMKRFFMVEKAKDANIVGIVVGTLGVADYLKVIERLKALIKQAGKKSYTFVVGKLNVPKLANFLEVDVFVLVACPENILLDSSEFYKPVVSVYEMELACNNDRQWTGNYSTDFKDILPGGSDYVPISDIEATTDVSLITGKLRTIGQVTPPEITSLSLMPRNEALSVTTVKAETADDFFASRSWKGLEQKLGETDICNVVEGQKGIASGYRNEKAET